MPAKAGIQFLALGPRLRGDERIVGSDLILYNGLVSTLIDDITLKIAARIRGERTARRWSLDDLSERSQVSKAMISKIERAEASPTAALLGRLSSAYGITLSALLAEDATARRGPVRAETQALWRDPATGYIRRQVAASTTSPIELTQVDLPPGAPVSFPAASYHRMSHVIWVLAGRLTFVEGDVTHDLGPGDSLEFGPPADCTYRNDGNAPCRYLVVLVRR
jgi:transcriptional regulator with XRE-family HTH domain